MDYHLEDFRVAGSSSPIVEAFRFGKRDSDRESCGIFVYENYKTEYKFIPLNNDNLIDKNFFTINNFLFKKYFLSNDIICLYHTHPNHDESISDFDIEISESLGLPSYILSLVSGETSLYYPKSHKPIPLKSRIFIPILQDCVIFFKDYYYHELNIKLQSHYKDWSRKRNGSNEFLLKNIKKEFFEVNINEVQKGDLIIFKPSFNNLNHVGIMDSVEHVYHQPLMMLPARELFTKDMQNKVYKCYRYKGL